MGNQVEFCMSSGTLDTLFPLNISLEPPKTDQVCFVQLEIFVDLNLQ